MRLSSPSIALLAALTSTACLQAPTADGEPTPVELREGGGGEHLRVVVAWQHESGPDPIPWIPAATVSLIDPYDPSALFTLIAEFEEGVGSVDLTSIPAGEYRVAVHSPGYLAAVSHETYLVGEGEEAEVDFTEPGTAIGEDTMVCEGTCALRAGDVDRNGRIDEADLKAILSGDAPISADFTRNGTVDEDDASVAAGNLGLTVAEPTLIYEASVPSGPCAVVSAGVGERYPACLTLEWQPKLVDCDALCAEYVADSCAEGCAGDLSCAETAVACPSCLLCGSEFVHCRRACRSQYPYG
ncbi:MAG: hypothetical protein AAF721_02980 [Myxococcota bacterium]